MKKSIALFINHPECSRDCCDAMSQALSPQFDIKLFDRTQVNESTLSGVDIVAFPGGLGDMDSYDKFFRRRAENCIADYVAQGGRYLGICMGAYWAGSQFFDILDGVDTVQYIARPGADVRRSYATVASVSWNNQHEDMYFYDGCALVGDESKFTTIARYTNNDPMAIIQGRIGLIGCHPESAEYWYKKPWQYINSKWHHGRHHKLLLDFADTLINT
jgi:glutamine amidotransferase-like uncharacterized protein